MKFDQIYQSDVSQLDTRKLSMRCRYREAELEYLIDVITRFMKRGASEQDDITFDSMAAFGQQLDKKMTSVFSENDILNTKCEEFQKQISHLERDIAFRDQVIITLKQDTNDLTTENGMRTDGSQKSVLLITMPKSGSVYYWKKIQRSLRLNSIQISNGYFPTDVICQKKFRVFLSVGYVFRIILMHQS